MKFRRIIKNTVRGKSVVSKFNEGDMNNPVHTAMYALSPLMALTYYYMQFILDDFMYERYPKYIEGTLKSAKVKDVFYYDKLEGFIIRSCPYTNDEKWKFRSQPTKAKLPERKKHLVLKKVEVDNNAVTSKEDDRNSGKIIDIRSSRGNIRQVERYKERITELRRGIPRAENRGSEESNTYEGCGQIKVVAECSRRPLHGRMKRGKLQSKLGK